MKLPSHVSRATGLFQRSRNKSILNIKKNYIKIKFPIYTFLKSQRQIKEISFQTIFGKNNVKFY